MNNQFLILNKNKKLLCDGLYLLSHIDNEKISLAIEDFQYRKILDKMKYGNEGESRMKKRSELPQMSDETIISFIIETARVLKPSSYLFLWVDKFTVAEGIHLDWINRNSFLKDRLVLVDKIVWHKGLYGMGARSRRTNEELLVYQKIPKTTKNWTDKGIPDTFTEKILSPRSKELHPHRKPMDFTKKLISATTKKGDFILDPCAGSFSTLDACIDTNRNFIGCDISPKYGKVKPE